MSQGLIQLVKDILAAPTNHMFTHSTLCPFLLLHFEDVICQNRATPTMTKPEEYLNKSL